jgi:hypothetical protein
MMRCSRCCEAVDTDYDLDSLYVIDGQCICEHCRTEEDDEILEAKLNAEVKP